LTPYVKFWADRYQIKAGESTFIRWQVERVNAYWVYREDQRWQDHPQTGSKGEMEVRPSETTIWYLRVQYLDGQVETRPCEIRVEQPPAQAPQIERFTVDPPAGEPQGQIWLGETVKIRWEIGGGQADEVRLTATGVLLDTRTDGSLDHTPEQEGPVEYALWARGPGGEDGELRTITVVVPVVPITPEPVPEDPVIYSFGVSPNHIQTGDCVNISWSAGGGATYVRIMRNGAVIVNDAGLEGKQSDCLDQPGDYTYQAMAGNVAKEVPSDPQSVNVTEAPPPAPPLAGTHWVVIAMNDAAGNPYPLLADVPLTATFGQGGALDGSAGCNTYSAVYQAKGDALTIGRVTTSRMSCGEPPGIMEQEAAFLAVLPAAANFVQEGSQLTILGPTGQVLLVLSMLLL
jgi:heat shock protein HslJ